MPFIVPFLPLIAGAAGGVANAIGNSKKRTATSTSQFDNSQSSTQRGVLDKRQKEVMKLLAAAFGDSLRAGPTVMQSDRNQARTQINNTFDSIRPRLEANLTARGFRDSGKVGASFKGLEIDRSNAFQDSEAELRSEAMDRFMRTLGLAQNFITPRKFESSGTSSGSSSGTQTQPGQSPWNAFGGAFGDIAQSLWLRQLMNQGSPDASSGGSGGWDYSGGEG